MEGCHFRKVKPVFFRQGNINFQGRVAVAVARVAHETPFSGKWNLAKDYSDYYSSARF
jgi:hypothetical protein